MFKNNLNILKGGLQLMELKKKYKEINFNEKNAFNN